MLDMFHLLFADSVKLISSVFCGIAGNSSEKSKIP
jgi:hypothetical protein